MLSPQLVGHDEGNGVVALPRYGSNVANPEAKGRCRRDIRGQDSPQGAKTTRRRTVAVAVTDSELPERDGNELQVMRNGNLIDLRELGELALEQLELHELAP